MIIKYLKPYTSSTRHRSVLDFSMLTRKKPEKQLTKHFHRSVGRNNQGKITSRHKGGGHKRNYRLIDFQRKKDTPGKVISIEYDPNRNTNIALIQYSDGDKKYILHPDKLQLGQLIQEPKEKLGVSIGSCLPLEFIPVGTEIHNIELIPGKGGQLIRAAGTAARILGKEKQYVIIRLASKQVRLISRSCKATIGRVSNSDYSNLVIGKAGRNRWLGIRPTVRGSAMNPIDHPHGGGEGRSPIGKPRPLTPWGKPALGIKTRKKKKKSNSLILRRN